MHNFLWFTANICSTLLQAIIAVKCHLSLILSGHRRVYLANCVRGRLVCVAGQNRVYYVHLIYFLIKISRKSNSATWCQLGVNRAGAMWAWCGDNSCVTGKMRNDQNECLAGKLHMQQLLCVRVCVCVRVCTPTGTSSAATRNIQHSQADVRPVHWANAVQNCSWSRNTNSSRSCSTTSSAGAGK